MTGAIDPSPPSIGRRGAIEVLTWPGIEALGATEAVVTTRYGGVSEGAYRSLNLGLHVGDDDAAVIENRQRAAAAIGLGLDDLVFTNQAHGRVVVDVDAGHRGRGVRSLAGAIPEADALVTRTPGVGLVVMAADCLPVLLVDPVTRAVACVHAGWRGTVARVLDAAIDGLRAGGTDPADVVAALGPAIPAHRYQVGEEVLDAARDSFGDTDGIIGPDGTGRWHFDLLTANRRLLEEGGVRPDRVLAGAPGSDDRHFFSDRAARPCGRFALLARLTDPAG